MGGDSGCDTSYGHGIVKAKTAFEYLEQNPCDVNESFKEPEGGCAEFSCSEDSDCDDGNPDTINTCSSGSCQSACASDAACDDNDPCTVDTCSDGVCSNVFDCSICGGGASSVLELKTDNYPGETEWDIKNSSGDEKYSGSGYSDANTLHIINMCLPSDEYTFYITDAYGDGFCCSYGNGYYKIKVDGTEKVSGDEFGDSKTETFTVNAQPTAPVAPPNTAPVAPSPAPVTPSPAPVTPTSSYSFSFSYNYTPVPSAPTTAPVSPTNAPVSPTNAPVSPTNAPVSPTTAPVTSPTAPVDTPSGCLMFVITLTTDEFGYETSFTLLNDLTGGIRLSGGLYASSRTYDEVTCLDNGRYIFTISDSHGDGMCCGNGQGGYTLTLGGHVLRHGGEFGESETTAVEVGPQGPTSEPTPAPVCTQTGVACVIGDNCCSGRCGNGICD